MANQGVQPVAVDEQTGRKPLPRGIKTKVQDEILDERVEAVRNDPKILEDRSQRWDLSDVFYETRNRLDSMGYNVDELSKSRKGINAHTKYYCDERGIKRHEIGIFAADRTVLAFQGQTYSVSFEDLDWLAGLGTDIICIEKEGILEKIFPYIKDFGIALLQSEGFMAEFGAMLAQKAKKYGANVAILTDFDDSGIMLAFELKDIPRIGIDFTTIDELNKLDKRLKLQIAKVRERYRGGNHWKALNRLMHGLEREGGKSRNYVPIKWTEHQKQYINYLNQTKTIVTVDANGRTTKQTVRYIDYLRNRRIELNSVFKRMGDKEGPEIFCEWLKKKITETFPTRDLNRAVVVPKYVLSPTMGEFGDKLKKSLTGTLQTTVDAIEEELTETRGLVKTDRKRAQILCDLTDEIIRDPKYQRVDSVLDGLITDELEDEGEEQG